MLYNKIKNVEIKKLKTGVYSCNILLKYIIIKKLIIVHNIIPKNKILNSFLYIRGY